MVPNVPPQKTSYVFQRLANRKIVEETNSYEWSENSFSSPPRHFVTSCVTRWNWLLNLNNILKISILSSLRILSRGRVESHSTIFTVLFWRKSIKIPVECHVLFQFSTDLCALSVLSGASEQLDGVEERSCGFNLDFNTRRKNVARLRSQKDLHRAKRTSKMWWSCSRLCPTIIKCYYIIARAAQSQRRRSWGRVRKTKCEASTSQVSIYSLRNRNNYTTDKVAISERWNLNEITIPVFDW